MYNCWKCGKEIKNDSVDRCPLCGAKKKENIERSIYDKQTILQQQKVCIAIHKERWFFLSILTGLVLLAVIATA